MLRPITRLFAAGSLCGLLGACASAGTPSPDDNQPSDRIVALGGSAANSKGGPGGASLGSDMGLVVHATDSYTGISARIDGRTPTIMDTLSGVYQDLGIPIGTRTSATWQIGNRDYRVPGHSLKKIPLSQLVDCGEAPMAGRRADVDAIRLNVISTIKPAKDSEAIVNTYVSAFARPLTSSSDPTQCASTGALEKMINERLIRAFGGRD